MKNLEGILVQITHLTNKLSTDYPELYKFIDEEPITMPSIEHPKVTIDAYKEYLSSLEQLITHYLATRKDI